MVREAWMGVTPTGSSAKANADPQPPKSTKSFKAIVKVPGCAYHFALVRANNFTKVAILAASAASGIAVVKYFLAKSGEDENIRNNLKATAQTVANTIRSKVESDLEALNSVGNLWRLDSALDREMYRKYVTSPLFKANLQTMTTVMLLHRVKHFQRQSLESHPSYIALRNDCCNGTKFDLSFALEDHCRVRAKHQCGLPDGTYHFIANEAGTNKKIRAPPSDEYMVIMAQEPFENNPAPMGFDMRTFASRKVAWEKAAATGKIAFTKRALRTFAVEPEFGIVTWLPLFVDEAVDGNKTLFEGVNMLSKDELLHLGKTPYPIASVSGVYVVSKILRNSLERVFGNELVHTKIFLFDDRADVKKDESLLSIYSGRPVADDLVKEQNLMPSEIMERSPDSQSNTIEIKGTDMSLTVIVEPDEFFIESNRSNAPTYILIVSLLLVLGAQIERWIGNPTFVSSATLRRSQAEANVRAEHEPEIQQRVEEKMNVEQVQEQHHLV